MDAHLFWLPVQKKIQNLAHTWEIRLIFCHLCHAMSTSKEEKEGHPSGWHPQWKNPPFLDVRPIGKGRCLLLC